MYVYFELLPRTVQYSSQYTRPGFTVRCEGQGVCLAHTRHSSSAQCVCSDCIYSFFSEIYLGSFYTLINVDYDLCDRRSSAIISCEFVICTRPRAGRVSAHRPRLPARTGRVSAHQGPRPVSVVRTVV